jgi:hypothetical protein
LFEIVFLAYVIWKIAIELVTDLVTWGIPSIKRLTLDVLPDSNPEPESVTINELVDWSNDGTSDCTVLSGCKNVNLQ